MSRKYRPHVVLQGDHVEKLAFSCSSTPDEVWSHPSNAGLRAKRSTMHQLLPGDLIHLPEGAAAGLALRLGANNLFVASVPVVEVSISVRTNEGPISGAPYVVEGLPLRDGETAPTGTTGPAGEVHLKVPVLVREVIVALPAHGVKCQVRIGDMDPMEEPSGVRMRLENLGLMHAGGEHDEALLRSAIRAFQVRVGLPPTGDADQATKAKLAEIAG